MSQASDSETKMMQCEDCGRLVPKSDLRRCHKCGKIVCKDCQKTHTCPPKKEWKAQQKARAEEGTGDFLTCDYCQKSFPASFMRRCRDCGVLLCPDCLKTHDCRWQPPNREEAVPLHRPVNESYSIPVGAVFSQYPETSSDVLDPNGYQGEPRYSSGSYQQPNQIPIYHEVVHEVPVYREVVREVPSQPRYEEVSPQYPQHAEVREKEPLSPRMKRFRLILILLIVLCILIMLCLLIVYGVIPVNGVTPLK